MILLVVLKATATNKPYAVSNRQGDKSHFARISCYILGEN